MASFKAPGDGDALIMQFDRKTRGFRFRFQGKNRSLACPCHS